jgi:hypothetical protein
MPRLTAALVAAALLVPAVAAADVHRFTIVESAALTTRVHDTNYTYLEIAGRLDSGDPVSAAYNRYQDSVDANKRLEHCHKVAMIALSKPGKYILEIDFRATGSRPGGNIAGCKLVAAP